MSQTAELNQALALINNAAAQLKEIEAKVKDIKAKMPRPKVVEPTPEEKKAKELDEAIDGVIGQIETAAESIQKQADQLKQGEGKANDATHPEHEAKQNGEETAKKKRW